MLKCNFFTNINYVQNELKRVKLMSSDVHFKKRLNRKKRCLHRLLALMLGFTQIVKEITQVLWVNWLLLTKVILANEWHLALVKNNVVPQHLIHHLNHWVNVVHDKHLLSIVLIAASLEKYLNVFLDDLVLLWIIWGFFWGFGS